nr:hypothetical protein [Nocardia xishanensis]
MTIWTHGPARVCIATMPDDIPHILSVSVEPEIIETIVLMVAVVVADLKPFGRRSHKCQHDKLMHSARLD